MRVNITAWLAAILLCFAASAASAQESDHASGQAKPPAYKGEVFPPWQHGANNDALDRGLEFTVPEVDDLADFHGDITDPKLVLYVAGNYFFAMAPLVQAFEAEHSEFKGRLYWETIPPGLLVKQLKANGVITSGNMTWTAKADVYLAGLRAVKKLIGDGLLEGPPVSYVTNTLAIMVAKGNPQHVTGLKDLANPKLRLAMPNPEFEGIARQIEESLKKAGGDALATTVYDSKVKDGSTILTHIHHRQTPLFLMQGIADAGVTWQSEAMFQEQAGHPIAHIDIPAEANTTAIYAGAVVKGAAHREAAQAWLEFIHSPKALEIFARYGFQPYHAPN
jgi:molybdate transport system substrate-binding protein